MFKNYLLSIAKGLALCTVLAPISLIILLARLLDYLERPGPSAELLESPATRLIQRHRLKVQRRCLGKRTQRMAATT